MKQLLLITFSLIYTSSFSQIKALTEDGKEVVLLDNKTWRFVNESDEKTLDLIETNETVFTKPDDASFLLRSKIMDVGVYFNPKKWKIIKNELTPTSEYTFQSIGNQQQFGIMLNEKAPINNLKNLKEIMLSSLEKRATFFRLHKSEYRNVNGLKVLFMDYSANFKGMDFHYLTNYYLTDEGYACIMAYSFEKDFPNSEKEIENLLNGLVKVDKSKVTETVVYTNPPPPMTTKKK